MESIRATTFELLPERIDLLGFVLSSAGVGALVGSLLGHMQRANQEARATYTEKSALALAGLALIAFLFVALIQALP